MRDVRMVIHVVARQIGEAAGGDAHAVEAVLVEPVRGGLEGKMRHFCHHGPLGPSMRDAVARDLVELAMQRDRIRRCQRTINGALRRYQADGADAGGGVTKPKPDLPREGRDRGLAAGAGHRRDRCRLLSKKSGGGERERAARIRRGDQRHATIAEQCMVAGYGNGA